MSDTVAFDIADRIAWVAFNRPEKRNSIGPGDKPCLAVYSRCKPGAKA